MHFSGGARVPYDGRMVGIQGLDPLGVVHASLGLLAVALGLAVVAMRKGTAAHRRAGLLYAIVMVLLNATALMIYELFGGFGPFHVLALVSLATVTAGVVPVWFRPRGWLDLHARFMSWSYAGLVAALFSEIGARLPGVGFTTGVVVPTAAVMLVASFLIHRRIPGLITRIALAALIVNGGTGHAAVVFEQVSPGCDAIQRITTKTGIGRRIPASLRSRKRRTGF
jgi:uncharacterized membrane protein